MNDATTPTTTRRPKRGAACAAPAALLALLALAATAHGEPVSQVSSNRIFINQGGRTVTVPYYRSHALGSFHPTARRAVIVIHGADRGARWNFDGMTAATTAAGATADTVILAPHFLTQEDITAHGLGDEVLYWSGNGWKFGHDSLHDAGVTSFRVIDLVVSCLIDSASYPLLEEIVVAGHSAGGQFVNRYAAGNTVDQEAAAAGVTMRYVVANPSTYLYFDRDRAEPGSLSSFDEPDAAATAACPAFNDYHYGLENRSGHMADVGTTTIRLQYWNRQVSYLLGEEDDEVCAEGLARSCEAMLEGSHRLERGLVYFNYLGHYYGDTAYDSHLLETIPGAGHGSWGTWNSEAGLRHIFAVAPAGMRAPTPLSPRGADAEARPTFRWLSVFGATWYRLQVVNSDGTSFQQWYRASSAGCEHGGLCSARPSGAFAGDTARWSVTPWRSGPGSGDTSASIPFWIGGPAAATTLAPSGTLIDHTPTFRWEAVPGASWYRLVVYDAGGAQRVGQWFHASVACPCLSTCAVNPGVQLPDGDGQWAVRTWGDEGWGEWSATVAFRLETPATLVEGDYTLRLRSSGKCLDADSGEDHLNGGNVQVWQYLGGANQEWHIEPFGSGTYRLRATSTDRCLDADNYDGLDFTNGGNVQLWNCHSGYNQRWRIERESDGYFHLTVRSSGKCLDADNYHDLDFTNGGNVQLWNCLGGDNQTWRIEPVDPFDF